MEISVTGNRLPSSRARRSPGPAWPAGPRRASLSSFTPAQLGPAQGSLQVSPGKMGRPLRFPLSGTGQGAAYSYQIQQGSVVAAQLPGQDDLLFRILRSDKTSAATVQVNNTGNASGPIASIAISGRRLPTGESPIPFQSRFPAGGSFQFSSGLRAYSVRPEYGATARSAQTRFNLSGNALGSALLLFVHSGGGQRYRCRTTELWASAPRRSAATSRRALFRSPTRGTAQAVISSIGVGGLEFSVQPFRTCLRCH